MNNFSYIMSHELLSSTRVDASLLAMVATIINGNIFLGIPLTLFISLNFRMGHLEISFDVDFSFFSMDAISSIFFFMVTLDGLFGSRNPSHDRDSERCTPSFMVLLFSLSLYLSIHLYLSPFDYPFYNFNYFSWQCFISVK